MNIKDANRRIDRRIFIDMYITCIEKCLSQSSPFMDDNNKRRRRKKATRKDERKECECGFFFHGDYNFCGLFEKKREKERDRKQEKK